MRKAKTWCLAVLAALLVLLAAAAGINAWVDPFFHYRAPREGIAYDMQSERYLNDGILKHFDYDAILLGSSVTMNFQTSQCDALFGCRIPDMWTSTNLPSWTRSSTDLSLFTIAVYISW